MPGTNISACLRYRSLFLCQVVTRIVEYRHAFSVLLILSAHALEGCSSHFVCLSVCLSVCRLSVHQSLSVADLEVGGLLALQRHMNLNRMTI